jgi:hypothetical protein
MFETNVLFYIVADLEHFLRRLVANDLRVVVRRVVAMSHCRSSQIEGFAICIYKSQATVQHGDNVSLATRRQCDNAPFGAFCYQKGDNDIGCYRYRQRNAQSLPNQPP